MTEPCRKIPPHLLPRFQAVFHRLVEAEGDPDVDWQALLALRERADPLTDDAYFRGYVMGVLDAVGVSVEEAVQVLRTSPRRRIIKLRRTR